MREQLADSIRSAIFEGKLHPGDRIVESKLCRAMNVGQPTLREALQVLEHEGLLSRVPKKGVVVTHLSHEMIGQIFDLRAELEALALAWAVPRATEEQLENAGSLLDRMEQAAGTGDVREYLRADLEFHRSLWRLSGNPYLEQALEPIMLPLVAFSQIRSMSPAPAQYKENIERHRSLIELVRTGPSERARKNGHRIILEFKKFTLSELRVAASR